MLYNVTLSDGAEIQVKATCAAQAIEDATVRGYPVASAELDVDDISISVLETITDREQLVEVAYALARDWQSSESGIDNVVIGILSATLARLNAEE